MRKLALGTLAAVVAMVALLSVSCEDAEPTAEEGWQLTLTANPGSIDIGPGQTGETNLIAVLRDDRGAPVPGYGVRFQTNRGTLDSAGNVVETDSNGEARDTLTLAYNDDEAEVLVNSGLLSASTQVFVGDLQAPTASISIQPSGGQRKGQSVLFSGSRSEDLDGEIVKYTWTITSSNPDPGADNPEVIEKTVSGFEKTYSNAQQLDVTLRVEDNDGLTDTEADFYDIVDNLPPVADAGPPLDGEPNPVTNRCAVQLNGCGSSDPDGAIVAYTWTIGTRSDTDFLDCQFETQVEARADPYTVTLTVHDDGDQSSVECTDPDLSTLPPGAGCTTRKTAEDQTTLLCNSGS
jgi:hypothetical protein